MGGVWVTLSSAILYPFAMLSSFSAPALLEKYGAKRVLLYSDIGFIFAAGLTAISSRGAIVLGRAVMGVGVGLSGVAVSPLLAEVSPAAQRGRIGAIHQLMIAIGSLLSSILGYAFCSYVRHGWKVANLVLALPAAIQLVLHDHVPQSPRWLLRKDFVREAEAVLRRFMDADTANDELHSMARDVQGPQHSVSGGSSSLVMGSPHEPSNARFLGDQASARVRSASRRDQTWMDVMALGRVAVVGLGLTVFQALSGVNIVVGFSTMPFRSAGLSEPILGTLLVSAANVATTVLCSRFLDYLGRRALLLASTSIMTGSLLLAGFVILTVENEVVLHVFAIFALVAYIFGFALGVGPATWVVVTEIIPTELRSKAMCLFIGSNWLANTAVVGLTQVAINGLGGCALTADPADEDACSDEKQMRGVSLLFILVSSICAAEAAFVFLYVPETKNLSLEEISRRFRKGNEGPRKIAEPQGDSSTFSLLAEEQEWDIDSPNGSDSR
eukprot:scaffold2473_cov247-Pinguiococcus_pyrenoidosus.AAC.2